MQGLIFVASWLFTLAIFSQGLATSARIAGMGGVSIAVDDLESDPFVNPAKAVRINKPLVLGDFSHQGYSYSSTSERSGVDHEAGYVYYYSRTHRYEYSPCTWLSRGVYFYPFGSGVVLGGSYQFSSSTYTSNYKDYNIDKWTFDDTVTLDSWGNYSNSWEDESPQNVISLLAGARITPRILFGFGTEFILESSRKEDSKMERTYWSSSGSDTSHHLGELEYKTTFSQKKFTGGILIDLSEKLEIDGTFSFSRYDQDHRQTKEVWDSIVVDPDFLSKHRNLAKEDSYSLSFAPKYRLNDLVRVASAISYSWRRRTSRKKDFGVKTDTGKEKFSSFNIGCGLSLTPDAKTLIAFDLILTPEKSTWDYFYTETETTHTGDVHRKGDISRTEERNYLNKTVRVGMERTLSNNFLLRMGSNFVITKYDLKTEDKGNERQEHSSPSMDRGVSTLTAGFGYLWKGRFKVDYALQASPSGFMWYGPLEFHHQLNLIYSL